MSDNVYQPAPATSAWWARSILSVAVVGAVLLPVAALGTRFGLWSIPVGFQLLTVGTVLGVIGLVTGVAGIVVAHRRRRAADKPAVYAGTAICAVILVMMGMQYYAAMSLPQIHNISTDVVDPPAFDKVVALRGDKANSLDFDASQIAPLQRQYYPWVNTLRTGLAPDVALQKAVAVLKDMGLDIVDVDEAGGRVEATASTFWFGFKDDMVVRVRSAPNGSFVDARSVSRVGLSDLGVNARRIGTFLDTFRQQSS